MAKSPSRKRSIRRKKPPRGERSVRDSEILRAKRAVSAALSVESARPEASDAESGSIGGVMKGLVRAAAKVVGQGAGTAEAPVGRYSGLEAVGNPLAELARRHIGESSESLSRSGGTSDRLCREVLANLARTRLGKTEASFSQSTRT